MKQQPTITQPHPPSRGDTTSLCRFPSTVATIAAAAEWTRLHELVCGSDPDPGGVWSQKIKQLMSLSRWVIDPSSSAASALTVWSNNLKACQKSGQKTVNLKFGGASDLKLSVSADRLLHVRYPGRVRSHSSSTGGIKKVLKGWVESWGWINEGEVQQDSIKVKKTEFTKV